MAVISDAPMDIYSDESVDVIIILEVEQLLQLGCLPIVLALDLFVLHVLAKRQLGEFEDLWEGELAIDLLVTKGVIVEHNSLQVHNEHVWHFAEQLSFLEVDFLVAAVAVKVLNSLAFNDFAEACVEILSVFNLC